MVIVINGRADRSIVLIPFVLGDPAISIAVIEAGEELTESLVLCHFTPLHLGVVGAVVDASQVVSVHVAVPVAVELEERLVHHCLPPGVRRASHSHEELVKTDTAVLVTVEIVEEDVVFNLAVTIEGVKRSEGAAEVADGLGPPLIELFTENVKDFQHTPLSHITMGNRSS